MKILLVPSQYLPTLGGVALNTHDLAKKLVELGHEVVVLTSNWRQWNLPFYERIEGVKVYRIPLNIFRGSLKSFLGFPLFSPVAIIWMYFLIRKWKPEVVNVHFIGINAFYILILHFLMRFPLVVTFHGNEVITVPDPSLVGPKGFSETEARLMTWTIRKILQRADHVTAVSQDLINIAKKFEPLAEKKSTRIFVGIKFSQNPQKFSDKFPEPFLLAVGRLTNQKGFEFLIDAFSHVTDNFKNLSLVIIGEGPLKRAIVKKIHQYRLEEKVILKGALPKQQIQPFYEKCIFLVAPSLWEGLPTVILEAFSFGKPVVASSVNGIPEVIEDGITGLLVEPENSWQLATAMMKLLKDPALTDKMGANAKIFVTKHNGWENVTFQYLDLYEKILKSRVAP